MVGGKRRGRPRKQATEKSPAVEEEEFLQQNDVENKENDYEQLRQQRIKENIQKMEKMGILDLSRKLTSEIKPPASKKSKTCPAKITTLPSSDTTRRSSRLTTIVRVDYAEKVRSPTKAARGARNTKIHLKQGSEPEIYTAEHEQLLGDCKTKWALYVDGYDKHGKRIYDPIAGKCCHQCRQKTLGRHTECSSCKTRSGQFCGDCLFMRYSENVIEVNKNPKWICPVCRGICNCSRCRLQKGWKPTGSIYKKVKNLGFNSVAHYLIQTRQAQTIQEPPNGENHYSESGMLPSGESEPTVRISKPESDCIGSEDSDSGSINGGV